MPLNKLENFIKNTEGRILYVNPNDLDSTDSITNQGNSLTKPFKTIQRALIESARFSYQPGIDNDDTDKTTILIYPGEHQIDNRPGFAIKPDPTDGTRALSVSPTGGEALASLTFGLSLTSEFDLSVENNVLYKFNSVYGGVIVPRGTSIVGMDLRKTKIRPLYVPNPTDDAVPPSAIMRITGSCYFWQFSFFDGNENGLVYTDHQQFNEANQSKPTFSHHKLTCFEYADGVNDVEGYVTDLSMYYYKLSYAYQEPTGRAVDYEYPNFLGDFDKVRPEYEIVGALGNDPIIITSIIAGDGTTATTQVTVTTQSPHGLTTGTPIKISGVNVTPYNISTSVQSVPSATQFTYLIPDVPANLPATPTNISAARATIEADTVKGASPYIFNTSLRSVYGMNGMKADGAKSTGFRSMVVAQFTGISLQKDDRAFVKYNKESRQYEGIAYQKTTGATLAAESSSTDPNTVYHLDSGAIYRKGWEQTHVEMDNDAVMQIVSVFAIGYNGHIKGSGGADASITNSNSNFGQHALIAGGFRPDAFPRDDQGYITHIVSPEWVPTYEEDRDKISYFQLDVNKTKQAGISSHLYLSGFDREDVPPLPLTQGYRLGANLNEELYVSIGGTEFGSPVYMPENVTTGVQTSSIGINSHQGTKFSTAGVPNTNFELAIQDIGIIDGETVRVISDAGDLPEGLEPNRVYYAIKPTSTALKLASTLSNAVNNIPISIYGGSDLRVESRVSDKKPNDIGHPVQFDDTQKNWYVLTDTNSNLYGQLNTNDYVKNNEETDASYFKRYEDRRGIDNKLYKVRYVIPKEAENSRDPVDGFVLQPSSTTGFAKTSDATATSITSSDNNFKRNYGFIATTSEVGNTVTVRAELPHGVKVGQLVYTENVLDSNNPTGADKKGYNGFYTVTAVPNNMEFQYSNTDVDGDTKNTGNFIDNTASRGLSLPRFTVKDNKGNFDVYRSTVLKPYAKDETDGVYLLEILASDYTPPTEFTDQQYSQQVSDFYPQLDRDNVRKNPPAMKSFARRAPLGKVDSNNILNSSTREAIDKFSQNFGVGLAVSSVTPVSAGVVTVQLDNQHDFNGVKEYENLSPFSSGTGFAVTDKYNVRLLDGSQNWNGATAHIKVGVGSTSITYFKLQSPGSGFIGGETLYPENFTGASIGVPTAGIINNVNDTIQVTGVGKTDDGYYRILSFPTPSSIAIAATVGDPTIIPHNSASGQYIFKSGPSVAIASTHFDVTTGLTTFTTSTPHNIRRGGQFTVVDNNNNKVGDFYSNTIASPNEFTSTTVTDPVFVSGYRILPHAFSDNNQTVDVKEAIGARYFNLYGGDSVGLKTDITNTATIIPVQHASGIGTANRFELGDYLELNEEIVRVSATGLTGSGNDSLTVLRGQLGTVPKTHAINTPMRKIKTLAVESRRPSILRASGHTFEYLGYGPGNYSTGLPQVQNRTLTETEEYLAQSQNRGGGTNVYTGLNNRGDFFIGNKKINSATGQEKSFDIPIPSITGEDPSANSVVFDEVTVKQRLNVEGGAGQNILSQLDGPVTMTNDVSMTGKVVSSGTIELAGDIDFTGSFPNGAAINNVLVGVGTNKNEITTKTLQGNLILNAAPGFRVAIATDTQYDAPVTYNQIVQNTGFTTFSGDVYFAGAGATFCGGPLHVCDDIVAFYGQSSDISLKENVSTLENPLAKVMQIRGTEYDWKEGNKNYSGHDIGVIAQDIEKVLPEAVSTKPDGTKGVHYNKLIPLLIEAVKDLSNKVDDIKDK
tara:strand:- start:213 stop:5474 length:5262 start_codon:yes stop_codon:yes gene_type:complete